MTNPNGKAMTAKEAVEKVGSIINDQVHAMRSHASVYCSDRESGQMRSEAEFLAEALATLEALAEENEKLQTFQSWASDELDLAKKEYLKLVESEAGLRAENAALKAEVVEWKDNYADAQGDAACYKAQADSFATLASEHKARAEKAEAENAALKEQLDAARPLLHAITHKYLIDEVDGGEDWKERVIRKALAYRASREEK